MSTNSFGLIGARRRCHVLQAVPNLLLGGLGWENVDGFLPLLGLLRFTKLKPMKSNPSVTRVTRVLSRLSVSSMRLAIRLKGGEHRLRASAAYQDGIIGVAV